MLHKSLAALVVGSTLLFAHHAVAGPILQPVGVSSPQGDFGGDFALINMINQSGLSAAYISGVIDFATYTASATHVSPGFGTNSGFANTGAPPGQFTFDLGALSSIDGLAFWAVQNPGSVTQFELFPDNDGNFGNGTGPSLGVFNIGQPPDPTAAQVVSFAPTTTRFIHQDVLDMAFGTPLIPGIGELAFRIVPAPGGLALLGLAGLMGTRRRRRTTRQRSDGLVRLRGSLGR